MPATIVAEVCYMIGRYRLGTAAEAAFRRSFASRNLVVADLVEDDSERMAQLAARLTDLDFQLGGGPVRGLLLYYFRSLVMPLLDALPATGRR